MKVTKIGLISASVFAVALTAAQARATNLADIYDLAISKDPQIAAAEANYMATREALPQARAGLLPSVSAGATTSDVERTLVNIGLVDDYNENSWQARLTQPLFRLDRWFSFQGAKNIEASAQAEFASQQQELIFRVSDSYLNILEANSQLVSARAERDAVKRQLEQVQQRFDVGLVAITDVLESTAAFDSSTVSVIEAEGRQDIAFETLLRLTDERYVEIDGLASEFPVEYPEPNDSEAWVARALEGNYELIAARGNVSSAQNNLYAARSQHLPTVDAQAQYFESVSGAGANPIAAEIEQRSYSLVLNVPIFSGGATASGSKQAGYRLEQSQRNFDLIQRQTVENTRNLFSAINTDVARVRARLRGIESSQSALDATQTGYEVGTRNIVDVLLAQQRLYLAQFQYASARYQYIRDTLRLKQTVGSLSPEDVYALNKFITADKSVARITPTTR
ncbi:MAG: outer membrane protein [Candidatus Azotimanducaceae bacterium]|jgi:outer membrane protein